jgi:nucleoside 2-deoxyribosyltransferase
LPKVYISSPLRLDEVNSVLDNRLRQEIGIDVFLPISLHKDHEIEESDPIIPKTCYDMIKQCDIIILVIPYGLSTAAEIGYAQSRKDLGESKTIIAYFSGLGITKQEAMIDYAVDYWTSSIEDLVSLISNRSKKNTNL